MQTYRRACPHCHTFNTLTPLRAGNSSGPEGHYERQLCGSCGHRADLPRLLCDCPRCKPPNPAPPQEA